MTSLDTDDGNDTSAVGHAQRLQAWARVDPVTVDADRCREVGNLPCPGEAKVLSALPRPRNHRPRSHRTLTSEEDDEQKERAAAQREEMIAGCPLSGSDR